MAEVIFVKPSAQLHASMQTVPTPAVAPTLQQSGDLPSAGLETGPDLTRTQMSRLLLLLISVCFASEVYQLIPISTQLSSDSVSANGVYICWYLLGLFFPCASRTSMQYA